MDKKVDKKRLLQDQKEEEVKKKYFELYKLKPDSISNTEPTKDQSIDGKDQNYEKYAPIIKGLAQLQQHAIKVNHIKGVQAEVLDNSGNLNKSITLLDSKLQKISTSPNRVVSVDQGKLNKQTRTEYTKNQAVWLQKRGYH